MTYPVREWFLAAYRAAFLLIPIGSALAQTPAVLSLESSTYLGGSKFDHARDVAFDAAGNMIVVGGTEAPAFQFTNSIVTPGSPESGVKAVDVFVAKFSPSGNLLWATLVGGPSYDRAYAVEVDAQGYIYVAGRGGIGFPVTPGAMQTTFMSGGAGSLYGNQDGFIFKMKPDGSALEWATYFGGTDASMIRDIALDAEGNVYIASQNSAGSSYPAHIQEVFDRGPYPRPAGKTDFVVAKVKADGSELLWGMHLGGSGDEAGEGSIRVDAAGNPVVLTATNSTNIQTTAGAYDRTYNGGWDFYIAKAHSDGSGLIFATYLGGANAEAVETHHLTIDGDGNIIVAAGTLSTDFPIVGGYDSTYNGSGGSGTGAGTNYAGDAVIAKLSADGSQLLASTFLGGRYGDQAEGVDVDAEGNVYVAGATYSDNFPVAGGAYQTSRGGAASGFVSKLSSTLGSLLYSTYLGGSDIDYLRALAVASNGSVGVAGEARSTNFPVKNAHQTSYGGLTDGAVARFEPPAITYSISGRITLAGSGLSGIAVELSGAQSQSTVTDAAGNYAFADLPGGDYTVTPSREGYSFTPPSHLFEALSGNRTADFATTATLYTISGQVMDGPAGLSGVTIALSGSQSGSAVTNASGNYSFANLGAGGHFNVTPSHANYSFTPATRTFGSLDGDETADFAASAALYSISGRVTLGGNGLAGVTVALSGSQNASAVTNASGNYSFASLGAGGTHVVTPSHSSYTFTPASRTFNSLDGDKTADFTAASCSYALSATQGSIGAGASTGNTVGVTAASGCAWTATSGAAWLSITSGASGSGNGTVTYSAQANAGTQRQGTLTIAGQTFTVSQAAASGGGSGPWYNAAWGYRKAITIQAAKVSGGPHSNFPALVRLNADANLAALARSDGNDIVFTLSDHATKLDHEIEFFSGATGKLAAWVRVPTLSGAANTTLYLYYGNPGASNQQNPSGVWDANYVGVWHLGNGDSVAANFYRDSAGGGNHGTLIDAKGNATNTPAAVADGMGFAGDSDARIRMAAAASLNNLAANGMTVEVWAQQDSRNRGYSWPRLLDKNNESAGGWRLLRNASGAVVFSSRWSDIDQWWQAGTVDKTKPTYLAVTYDGSSAANNPSMYQNGQRQTIASQSARPKGTLGGDAAVQLTFANHSNGNRAFDGTLDEVRISKTIRSEGWIQTTYHTIQSPEAFLSVGSQQSRAGNQEPDPENDGPGEPSCSYALGATQATVGAEPSGGNAVNVTAEPGCAWTATSGAAWLLITSGASGSGNGTVTYSAQANAGGQRQGVLTIAGQTFTVTQQAAPCSYSISPAEADAGADAATGSVAVTAAAGCAWTATSGAAWLSITSGASGSGNGTVTYAAQANPGGQRQGTLTIAGQTFTVSQQAAACSYSISPAEANAGADAATGSVAVTAASGCAWTATSGAAWLSITSGASGSGNGTVTYSAQANAGTQRQGTLTIAGQTFTVSQAAASGGGSGPWYNAAWGYRKAITIQAAKVSGGPHSNFPALVRLNADANLAALARSDGNDIVFTLSDHATKLDHEIEFFSGATGKLAAWVRVPTLSGAANTTLYLYYGNPGASNQQNPSGVWDANYVGVWHLGNGDSVAANFYRDSAGGGNHGTLIDAKGNATNTPAAVADGMGFAGDSDARIRMAAAASLNNLAANGMTVEVWAQQDSRNRGYSWPRLLDKNNESAGGWRLLRNASGAVVFSSRWSDIDQWWQAGTVDKTKPTYLAVTYDGSSAANNPSMYQNGQRQTIASQSARPKGTLGGDAAVQLTFANHSNGNRAFDGTLDEVRISKTIRSEGWIQTTYYTIQSPEAFLSVGEQEAK